MRIVEEGTDALEQYETVSIAFEANTRIRIDALIASDELIADPMERRWKNYDDCEEDRPTVLARRFDFSNCGILSAFDGDHRIGGLIVARDTPGCEVLEGRTDLAVVFDLRVDTHFRRSGVGRTLFDAARTWAVARRCAELRVETQDINVSACFFYQRMGCVVHSAERGAYGPRVDEAKLIWRVSLRT